MSQFNNNSPSIMLTICQRMDPVAVKHYLKIQKALAETELVMAKVVGRAARPLVRAIGREIEGTVLKVIEDQNIQMSQEAETALAHALAQVANDPKLHDTIVSIVLKAEHGQLPKEKEDFFTAPIESKQSSKPTTKVKNKESSIEDVNDYEDVPTPSEKELIKQLGIGVESPFSFLKNDDAEEGEVKKNKVNHRRRRNNSASI